MPRILSITGETQEPLRERVRRIIAKLKPGSAIVAMELSEELGVTMHALGPCIPKANRCLRGVGGYHKPVLLIICPETSPSRPPKRRK